MILALVPVPLQNEIPYPDKNSMRDYSDRVVSRGCSFFYFLPDGDIHSVVAVESDTIYLHYKYKFLSDGKVL